MTSKGPDGQGRSIEEDHFDLVAWVKRKNQDPDLDPDPESDPEEDEGNHDHDVPEETLEAWSAKFTEALIDAVIRDEEELERWSEEMNWRFDRVELETPHIDQEKDLEPPERNRPTKRIPARTAEENDSEVMSAGIAKERARLIRQKRRNKQQEKNQHW